MVAVNSPLDRLGGIPVFVDENLAPLSIVKVRDRDGRISKIYCDSIDTVRFLVSDPSRADDKEFLRQLGISQWELPE